MRRWTAGMREGFRVLCSRAFWADFRHYWSGDQIAARMDAWVERVRQTHETPRQPSEED